MTKENNKLTRDKEKLKEINEKFKDKVTNKIIQYKNLGKIILNIVSVSAKNMSLIKKEMNLMMNKLR